MFKFIPAMLIMATFIGAQAQSAQECVGAERLTLESVCREKTHVVAKISYQGKRTVDRLSFGVELPGEKYSGAFKFQDVDEIDGPGTYTVKARILPSQQKRKLGRVQNMHYIFVDGSKQGCGLFNNNFPAGSGRENRYPLIESCK